MNSPVRHCFSALILGAVVSAAAVVSHAQVATVMLHEFIPPDPSEDVELAATTSDGRLPAAMQTKSGVVQAPDTARMPTATEKAYGGISTAKSRDNVYRPDRDTRRPVVSRYDDPFSPATTPYKRLRAYDAVAPDFTLKVQDPSLRPVPEGGMVRPGEDVFYGDITVDVVPGEAVRIPGVGPGARIVSRTSVPPMALEVLRDGADNWFVRAGMRARVRLVEQVAIPRAAFGGRFPDTVRGSARRVPALPSTVARSAAEVARHLGLDDEHSTRVVVTQLVAYFRAFEPSDQPPRGRANIYLDLALARKGVCRHRAYAFVITALGLGIPSRMVVNEAHAWVEAYDGAIWRRIDLGGAATHLASDEEDLEAVPHSTPPDPFPWPAGSDSGEAMAQRARAEQGAGSGPSRSNPRSGGGPGIAYPTPSSAVAPNAPPAEISITGSSTRVMRGEPLRVEGTARSSLGPCRHLRINVALLNPKVAGETVIGSLSTDEDGRFRGAVVVPLEADVGEYDLFVWTPGDLRCGPGRSER